MRVASDRTKRQLLEEIRVLRSRNAKLERNSRQMPSSEGVPPRSNTGKALTNRLILIGVGLAAFYWLLESSIHTFVFQNGSFFDQILPSNAHELWMRLVVCFVLIWFSIYAQIIVKQLRQAKAELQQSHDELEFRIRERTAELVKTNEKLQVEIIDHKKAEEVIRLSEEKFSKAFHSSPDSIAITSIENGRLLEINEGFQKIFGYSQYEAQ